MGLADSLRAWLTNSGFQNLSRHKPIGRDVSRKRLSMAVHHAIEPLEKRMMLTATPLYWDPNAAATAGGGSGSWDTTTAEWRTGSPTGALVAWSNSGDSNGAFAAVFPAASATVTLDISVTVQSISFAGGYYDLTTSNSSILTFAGGIGQIDVASSGTATFDAGISASPGITKTSAGTLALTGTVTDTDSATLEVEQGSVAVSGDHSWQDVDVDTSGTFILQGSGTNLVASSDITVDGLFSHYAGIIQTPTLTIDSSGAFRDQAGSLGGTTGGIAVSNAGMFISVTDQSLVGATGTFDNTGTYEVDNSTGSGTTTLGLSFTNAGGTIDVTGGTLSVPSLSLQNGTLLTLNGSGTFTVPVLDDDNGSIDQVSGTFTIPQGLTFGDHFQSGATYTLAGGTLNVGALYVGNFSTASLIQTGGTLNSQHTEIGSFGNGTYFQPGGTSNFTDLYVGYYGVGTFELSGGTANTSSFQAGYGGTADIYLSGSGTLVAGTEFLGRSGGTASFDQTGGDNNIGTGGLDIGDAAGTGNYVLSGGTLSLGFLVIGSNQNGIGTYTQTGGTATVQYNVYDGDSSGANGHLNMSGGSLSVLTFFAGAPGATGTVNLTGGTISVSTDMIIGVDSVWTQMNISGGTLDVTGSIAVGYSSPGEVDQSGGTVNIGLYLYVSPDAVDGYPGFSQYTLSGSGHLTTDVTYVGYFGSASFIQTGGTFTPTDLVLDGPSGTIGTYNHSGGTLASTATIINVLVPTASGAGVVNEGSLYTLNLAATSSIGNNAIQSWAVGWGDGASDSLSGNPSSTQHTYDNGGNAYTISATATGNGKSYTSTPVHVLVNDLAANVAGISDKTIATGSTLSIFTTFTDPGINETHTGTISWGDGITSTATITETVGTGYGTIAASHIYQKHGSYTPVLTITDSGGASASVSFNVIATYVAPTLAVVGPSTSATANASTVIQLHDYGPETTGVTSWLVNWGDGSAVQTVSTLPTSITTSDAEWDVPHTYTVAGDYSVSATAIDSAGSHSAGASSVYVQRSTFSPLAIVQESNELIGVTLTGDAGSDRFFADWKNGSLELFQEASPLSASNPQTPLYSIPASELQGVTIAGGGGADSLTVDYENVGSTGTAAPFGPDGLTFFGGASSVPDKLILMAGPAPAGTGVPAGAVTAGTTPYTDDDQLTLAGSTSGTATATFTPYGTGTSPAVLHYSNASVDIEGSTRHLHVLAQAGAAATIINSVPNTLDVDTGTGGTINIGTDEDVHDLGTADAGTINVVAPSGNSGQPTYIRSLSLDLSSTNPVPSVGLQLEGPELDLTGPGDGGTHAITIGATSTTIDGHTVYYFPGTLVTFTPGAANTTLDVDGGNATINSDVPTGGTLAVEASAGGSVEFDSTIHLTSLTSNPGGTARMSQAGNHILITDSLTVCAPASGVSGGVLDLADNDMIVHGGNLTDIAGLISAGWDRWKWDGDATFTSAASLISDVAAADPANFEALGYAQITQTGSFDNQSVNSGDVVVKFTFYGDANLDGMVNGSDYTNIDNGAASNLTGWSNGDFNYDGVVDGTDYTLIDNERHRLDAPASMTLTAGTAFPYSSLPTSTEVGNTIASWQVDWGNGSPSTTINSTPFITPYTVVGNYIAMFTPLDSNGDPVYHYPHIAVDVEVNRTTSPYISGNATTKTGVAYTLNLFTGGVSFDHWSINWGDGMTSANVPSTDSSFSHTFTGAEANDTISAEAINSQNQIVATATLSDLDASVGVDGEITISPGNQIAVATALQSDGDILVLTKSGLERFLPSGLLDSSNFGTGGIAPLPSLPSENIDFTTLAASETGQIAIGGFDSNQFVLGIYNAAGQLLSQSSMPSAATSPFSMTDMQFQGTEIALVGQDANGDVLDLYNTANNEPAFQDAIDGANGSDTPLAVAINSEDGSIWVTGTKTSDGFLDHFDPSGNLISSSSVPDSQLTSPIAIQSNENLMIGGADLLQAFVDGTLNSGFGGTGSIAPPTSDFFSQLLALPNGEMLAMDQCFNTLTLYNSNGTVDSGFGVAGTLAVNMRLRVSSFAGDVGASIQLSDGDYELAGVSWNGNVEVDFVTPANAVHVLAPPSVSLKTIGSATDGTPVTINAAVTSGGSNSDTITYAWTVRDGGGNVVSLSNGGITGSPSLTFTPSSYGNFTVALEATDSTLSLSTTVGPSTFTVAPPPLAVTGPASATEGSTVTYLATGGSAPTWTVTEVVSGISTSVPFTASGNQISFNPATAGIYTVQVSSPVAVGPAQTVDTSLTVYYTAPTVSIVGPSVGFASKSLSYSSNVTQSQGLNDSLSYLWQIKNANGTPYAYPNGLSTTSAGIYPNDLSTFVVPGFLTANTYELALTVTDAHDNTSTQISDVFDFTVVSTTQYTSSQSNQFTFATVPDVSNITSSSTTDFTAYDNDSSVLTQQADGKIILVGDNRAGFDEMIEGGISPTAEPDAGAQSEGVFIARFNTDLTLDTSFGPDHTGLIYPNILLSSNAYNIFAAKMNPINQDIIVCGMESLPGTVSEYLGSYSQPFVAEFLSVPKLFNGQLYLPGAPDPTFNGGSAVEIDLSAEVDGEGTGLADAIAVAPNGAIVVAGSQLSPVGYNDFFVARVTSAGVDTSFNVNGVAQEPYVNPTPDTPDPDNTPEGDRFVHFQGAFGGADATSLVIIPGTTANPDDYKIVAGGFSDPNLVEGDPGQLLPLQQPYESTLVAYNADGTLDSSFTTPDNLSTIPGVVITPPIAFNSNDQWSGIAALELVANPSQPATNMIVAVGAAGDFSSDMGSYGPNWQVAISEYDTSGSLITSSANVAYTRTFISPFLQGEPFTWSMATPFSPGAVLGTYAFEPGDGSIIASEDVGADSANVQSQGWTTVHIYLSGIQDMTYGIGGSASLLSTTVLPATSPGESSATAWAAGSMIATDNGIFTAARETWGADPSEYPSFAAGQPLLIGYNYVPKVTDVSAVAQSNGDVDLSWVNSGTSTDGFEIERATSVAALNDASSLVAVVESDQSSYDDLNVPATGDPYFYQVVPFDTNSDGTQNFLSSAAAISNSVISLPAGAGLQLVQTLSVELNGSTTNSSTLSAGTTYLIEASGTTSSPTPSLADGFKADPAYWYSTATPSIDGNTLDLVAGTGAAEPFGLGFYSGANPANGGAVPNWGPFNDGTHTYTDAYSPSSNQSLSFQFYDADEAALSTSLSGQTIQVRIYAVQTSGTGGSDLAITSPASAGGVPAIVSVPTPIKIISVGSSAWSLSLIFPDSGTEVLATGNSAVGQDPATGASVVTLDPSLYPNGLYKLQLTSDSSTKIVPIDIDNITKLGDLTDSVSDGSITTSAGEQLPLTRVYDSARSNSPGAFGNGWNLNLLDSQMQVTTVPNTYDPGQTSDSLQTGNLFSFTVPDGGQFSFEFAPTMEDQNWTYAASATSVPYEPNFISLDGSGATLRLINTVEEPNDSGDEDSVTNSQPQDLGIAGGKLSLAFDSKDDEFVAFYNAADFYYDGSNAPPTEEQYIGVDPTGSTYLPIENADAINTENYVNPEPIQYALTTSDGTSYIIDGTNGQIESCINSSGTIVYQLNDSTGQIVDGNNQNLLNITWSGGGNWEGSTITSMQVPGQNAIGYSYDQNGNLASVIDPTGNQTNYSYLQSGPDSSAPHLLTGIANNLGISTLQAQYSSSTGALQSVTDRYGVYIPIPDASVFGDQGTRTIADDAGDVDELIYNQYGGVVRNVQPLFNLDAAGDAGTLTGYQVTPSDRSYAVTQNGFGSGNNGLLTVLQSDETFSSFEISGSDQDLLRYMEQPAPATMTHEQTYVTGGEFLGQILATSTPVNFDELKTVTNSNFAVVDVSTNEIKPLTIITTIGISNGVTYTEHVQSAVYAVYNMAAGNGELIDDFSLVDPGATTPIGEGTGYDYNSDGQTIDTYSITATVSSAGAISITRVGGPLSGGFLSKNVYYTASDVSNNVAGALAGQVEYSTNASGQISFSAYTPTGETALSYVLKPITLASGGTINVWIGTTNVYDPSGRIIDTYQTTYHDDSGVLYTQSTGAGNVVVNTKYNAVYAAPLRTVHDDYNSLSQLADSVDQYGGTTSYVYDSNGRTIETLSPDGTEVLTVYNQIGQQIWTTNAFIPGGNTDTIIGTNSIYNDQGKVIQTVQYEGTVIVVSGSSSSVQTPGTSVGSTLANSSTYQFYNSQGQLVETDSPSGLRTGTIYYPDGETAYSGILLSTALNATQAAAAGGTATAWYDDANITTDPIPTDYFSSHTASASDLYSASGLFYSTATDQKFHTTSSYTDALGRSVRTGYADGSFTETLYSIGTSPVTSDKEGDPIYNPTNHWNGISAGGYEEVTIAQRFAGGPRVLTYDLYNASNQLTDVWQPAVTDGDPDSTSYNTTVEPHTGYVYDSAGNEIMQTDAKGNVTAFGYDQNGNQIIQTLPDLHSETWTYNANNQVATHKDFDGNIASYTYIPAGPQAGLLQQVVYTGSTGSGKAAQTVSYTYNDLNQQMTVTDASGTTTSHFDAFGNLIESDTPEGNIHYVFDPATQNHIETYTANTDTVYDYDSQGRLTSVTVDKLNATTLTTPLVTTYTYDDAGNKLSETLPDGEVTSYTYDDLNRLTGLTEVQPATTGPAAITDFSQTYSLNPDGTRESSTEIQLQPDGTIQKIYSSWSYDPEDRLTGESISTFSGPDGLADGFTLPAAYNPFSFGTLQLNGKVPMMWDGNHAYLSTGLTESQIGIGEGAALLAPTTTMGSAYLTFGGNGTDWVLVISDGNGHQDVETFSLVSGVFTPDGVRTGSDFSTTPTFTIDAKAANYNDTYTYDLNANRMQDTHIGPGGGASQTTTYTYNNDDELTGQTSSLSGTTSNIDDANGSQLTSTNGSTVTTYTYDVRNKLVGYSNGTTSATYVYDDDGDRVAETATIGGISTTTHYLTDTQNPTGYDQPLEATEGSARTTYILGDRVLGQLIGTNPVQYLLVDGHGSTQQITSATGVVTTALLYDAFGTPLNFTAASVGTVILFGGDAIYDTASGMYEHGDGARPTYGFEFIQRDPTTGNKQDPLSLHKYLYASANPIDNSDPSGDFFLIDTLGAAADEASETAEEGLLTDAADTLASDVVGDIEQDQLADELVEAADDAGSDSAKANELTDEGLGEQSNTAEESENGEDDEDEDEDGGLPVFKVYYAITPFIALHDQAAIDAGYGDILKYNGAANNSLTRQNRRDALRGLPKLSSGAFLNSWDEYPFASTAEGGADTSVAPVPRLENNIQGGQLSVFYGLHAYAPFEFRVEVVL